MKRIRGRVIIGVLILFAVLLIMFSIRTNTIEDALNESNQKGSVILHVEEVEYGSIVLYTHENLDDLSISIVRKSMGRNKVIYSSTQGELQKTLDITGISYGFMPGVNGLSFPIYYGVIGNSQLDQVKIIERERGFSAQAKIIEVAGKRLWYVNMSDFKDSDFKGNDFEIIGTAADGENLVCIEDSIEFLTLELKQK